jgi:predicted ABC-type transport system involved in lysophospholipase L1 biosynthesis ATPase subunit
VIIRGGHPLVPELNRSQFETAYLPQIFARSSAERMKAIRARRSFDAAPIEHRIKHFPSQIVGIMRPRVIIGSAKHKVIGTDIFGTLEVVRKDALQTSRHMPDVFLIGFC